MLDAPIENMIAPPTGWPSAEITRQLSTCVPAARPGGTGMTTVAFSAPTSRRAIGSPLGPMRRITSGETGSLKVSFSADGGDGIIAPSGGSAFTSDACARAAGA